MPDPVAMRNVADPVGPLDTYLFAEGTHRRLHHVLGAHLRLGDGGEETGARFAVWAPNARDVAVAILGDDTHHPLHPVGSSGIWQGDVPAARSGDAYRYRLTDASGRVVERLDPVAARSGEVDGDGGGAPRRHSVVDRSMHRWGDDEWMAQRIDRLATTPMSIYEVHLGSWGRTVGAGGRFPTYEELAAPLADHASAHGFTHVELLPLTEHPYYGSWGYQCTGYFSPTWRYGTPDQLRAMIDHLHQRDIGVILDWVPSHFATDADALVEFDGTHLYEHADPRQGHHPDWGSAIFNYGRNEVRSFLVSSAMSWLERYHVDGLRVDAVASMLYLDYSRKPGEWIPNVHGGRENLDAVSFLREVNDAVHEDHPGALTIAEESTAWPGVTAPTRDGGLGFDLKWDMGWMHDTLRYLAHDPAHRRWHHHDLTFRSMYARSEAFVLPLSHDEVVHGKGTLLTKQSGDRWQQFANLRLLLGYQWTVPGVPLLFMGGEFAVPSEWNHEGTLDWSLHDAPGNDGVRRWVTALNAALSAEPALWSGDHRDDGFEWIIGDDAEQSVIAFERRAAGGERPVVVIANFTPVVRRDYRVGVPLTGSWTEVLNGDDAEFGGSGVSAVGAGGSTPAEAIAAHGRSTSIVVTLPPLSVVVLAPA
ncbi:MAG: 1,4-alpha-glucan branching protein GlgB [Acidimicrobiales bacterium]